MLTTWYSFLTLGYQRSSCWDHHLASLTFISLQLLRIKTKLNFDPFYNLFSFTAPQSLVVLYYLCFRSVPVLGARQESNNLSSPKVLPKWRKGTLMWITASKKWENVFNKFLSWQQCGWGETIFYSEDTVNHSSKAICCLLCISLYGFLCLSVFLKLLLPCTRWGAYRVQIPLARLLNVMSLERHRESVCVCTSERGKDKEFHLLVSVHWRQNRSCKKTELKIEMVAYFSHFTFLSFFFLSVSLFVFIHISHTHWVTHV